MRGCWWTIRVRSCAAKLVWPHRAQRQEQVGARLLDRQEGVHEVQAAAQVEVARSLMPRVGEQDVDALFAGALRSGRGGQL